MRRYYGGFTTGLGNIRAAGYTISQLIIVWIEHADLLICKVLAKFDLPYSE
jgi:hypothetical protein